jgi:hypothetical protein
MGKNLAKGMARETVSAVKNMASPTATKKAASKKAPAKAVKKVAGKTSARGR